MSNESKIEQNGDRSISVEVCPKVNLILKRNKHIIVDQALLDEIEQLSFKRMTLKDICTSIGIGRTRFNELRVEYPEIDYLIAKARVNRKRKIIDKVDWWIDSEHPASVRLLESAFAYYFLRGTKDKDDKTLSARRIEMNKDLEDFAAQMKAKYESET